MKKLIMGLLTVVLLAGLVLFPGCAKPAEEKERLLISAVFQYALSDFFAPTRVGVEDAAEDYGVDFEWLGPPTYEVLELIAIIETVLSKGEVDGFVIEVGDPDVLLPIAKRIKDAGIPMVVTNELYEHDYYDSFCGADGITVGEMIGEQMELSLLGESVWAKAVGYEGTGEVEGKIAFALDTPGALNIEKRITGAKDYLAQFPGIVNVGVYDTTPEFAKGREVMDNILTAHPDLAGLCSVALIGGYGMGMAVKERGLVGEVVIVSMDLHPLTLELVKEGVLASTIGQNPYLQGYLPVEALAKYLLDGTPMPRFMPTNIEVVDLDNIDFIIAREEAYLP